MLRAVSLLLISTTLLIALLPPPLAAHGAGGPWLFVPADQVEQGETFTVIGADLSPGAAITLDLSADGTRTPLGNVTAAADGHFEATFVVPDSIPDGYAELWATDAAGLEATTWLLVGSEAGAVGGPPNRQGGPWWADPSVLVLGGLLGGAAIALVWLLLRSRASSPARASAGPEPRVRPRPVARKTSGKGRRRAH